MKNSGSRSPNINVKKMGLVGQLEEIKEEFDHWSRSSFESSNSERSSSSSANSQQY